VKESVGAKKLRNKLRAGAALYLRGVWGEEL
jgi:hypothetical protein